MESNGRKNTRKSMANHNFLPLICPLFFGGHLPKFVPSNNSNSKIPQCFSPANIFHYTYRNLRTYSTIDYKQWLYIVAACSSHSDVSPVVKSNIRSTGKYASHSKQVSH